ncbi:MAG: 7-cyano-7-deazaguanine synthase [Luteitalea sp.]|nr:7-cyano-7-deazaguanine synthase [Luteitalea sp.]
MCIGVLCSAGLDSVVLLAHEAKRAEVQPIYVAVGFAWEADERRQLDDVIAAMTDHGHIRPPRVLEVSMRDVYAPTHWAIQGNAPAYHTPDDHVYIVGRNVTLLSKAAIFCAHASIHELALGPLAGNPFPDATPEFFRALEQALSLGLAHDIAISTPFRDLPKAKVLRLGVALGVPLHLTLSCMSPGGRRHCGRCSKCRERQEAFRQAELSDPTDYVRRSDG